MPRSEHVRTRKQSEGVEREDPERQNPPVHTVQALSVHAATKSRN